MNNLELKNLSMENLKEYMSKVMYLENDENDTSEFMEIKETYHREYWNNIFPQELEYVKENCQDIRNNINTLVLLVGESLEPLMFSIGVWKPKNIILVLNRYYSENKSSSGKSKEVKEQIENVFSDFKPQVVDILDEEGEGCYLENDSPEKVFEYLYKNVKNFEDVVIDVTGGKKSMVVGAFFYAAYNDCKISYVDFDKEAYQVTLQRPLGYGSRITELQNPYALYSLKDWEQIKSLYNSYSFQSVMEILKNLRKQVSKSYNPEQLSSFEKLIDVIEMYNLWDAQDYTMAYKKAAEIKFDKELLPEIVARHSDSWDYCSQILNNFNERNVLQLSEELDDKIITSLENAYVYILDEIKRIGRLYNDYNDYRAAFMKAAALSEFILTVVVCNLEKQKLIEVYDITDLQVEINFIRHLTMADRIKIILLQNGRYFLKKPSNWHPGFKIKFKTPNMCETLRIQYSNILPNIKVVSLIRNNLIHGCFPVNRELCEKAIGSLQNNFNVFKNYSQLNRDVNCKIIPWSKLYDFCKLDKIIGVMRDE